MDRWLSRTTHHLACEKVGSLRRGARPRVPQLPAIPDALLLRVDDLDDPHLLDSDLDLRLDTGLLRSCHPCVRHKHRRGDPGIQWRDVPLSTLHPLRKPTQQVNEQPDRVPLWVKRTAIALAVLLVMAVIGGMTVY